MGCNFSVSTSSHKWETYRRRRFGRFSRRRATSILRSVRKERATQKIGQSAIGPPGWLEKGPSASLLARHGSQRIRSSLAPSIQTLLKPTVCLPLMRRCTSLKFLRFCGTMLLGAASLSVATAWGQVETPASAGSPSGPRLVDPVSPQITPTPADRSKPLPKSRQAAPTRSPIVVKPAVPLSQRDPYLSELGTILSASQDPLEVHLCFAAKSELTNIQIGQGAALSEALALRAGYRPLFVSHGPEPEPNKFNVVIGTVDQLRNFIPDQEAKLVQKGYLSIQRIPGQSNGFVLVVAGRQPEDIDSSVLSLGFVRVQLPDKSSVSIRDVILPDAPPFFRQDPLEANKTITFGQLQQSGAELSSLPTGGLALTMFFPGYYDIAGDSPVTINLHYSLRAHTFRSSGSLVVRINGNEVSPHQSSPTVSAKGGNEISYTFPLRLFQYGKNVLEITTGDTTSETSETNNLRIFSDSDLTLPKILIGPKLPDLRLETRTFYPFIGQPNGADLALLLAGRNDETIHAAWTLLARLAQSANTFFYAMQLSFDQYEARRNVLVVGTYANLPPAFRVMAEMRAFDQAHLNVPLAQLNSVSSGTNLKKLIEKLLDQRKKRAAELSKATESANVSGVALVDREFGVIATAPPAAIGRGWTLVVTAFTEQSLLRRVRSLVQPPFWNQIRGDIDRWGEEPASFEAHVPGEAHEAERNPLVELPLGERLSFRLWVAIVVFSLLVFVILTSKILAKLDQRRISGPGSEQ